MAYDLIVQGGTVVDGSGLPRYRADIGIVDGRIAAIGKLAGQARRTLDADGLVVSPGFIDGHTHMDAQVFWDPLGRSSCWHGVTTAVFGHCGFTLAPVRTDERHLVTGNLERAEDIPATAIEHGLEWTWETFPEFLDALDGLPKGINYAANIGHSALRTWAMGTDAFERAANVDEIEAMGKQLLAALQAGAIGFTTSRSIDHETRDNRPVASRLAPWSEVEQLVAVLGQVEGGLFELANGPEVRSADPEERRQYLGRIGKLAIETGVPVVFGIIPTTAEGYDWKDQLAFLDSTAAAGGRIHGMSNCRGIAGLLSFQTRLPFDNLDAWRDIRALPTAQQIEAFRNPDTRARLVDAAHRGPYMRAIGAEARPPDFESIRVLQSMTDLNPTVGQMARAWGTDPVELMIDLAVSTNFKQFFVQPFSVPDEQADLSILRHPRTIMTFSDSGAHVSQIMDSSIHTYLLAHWVRERKAITLEEAIQMITLAPASAWGFADRGLLREGFVADLNIFDPATVAPDVPTVEHDLPGGGKRLAQTATGIHATVVAGEVLIADGKHTGALPGQLLRRRR